MKYVFMLDSRNRYYGVEQVSDAAARDRVVVPEQINPELIDLPPDGSYKWDGQRFVPLGHGFDRPARQPVQTDHALFLLMRAILDGTPIPDEVRQYVDWYAAEIMERVEESREAAKRRSGP